MDVGRQAADGDGRANYLRSTGRGRPVIGLASVVAIAAVAVGGLYFAVGSPTIPAGSAATRIAVAENAAAAATGDPVGDVAVGAAPLVADACLDRITGAAGWLDLCWTVGRLMTETDATLDYYVLRVSGTIHGEGAPSGLRWAVIRAGPDEASGPFEIRDEWPGISVYEGACREASTGMGIFGDETTTVCGRTVGEVDTSAPQTSALEWTCAGCLLPMSGNREVFMAVGVAVPEGKTPIWDLYADLGS